MNAEESDAILAPIVERCARTDWRWRWRVYREREHWRCELKVRGAGEFGDEAKVWIKTSTHTAPAALQSAVDVAMRLIGKNDAIEARDKAHWARLEEHDPGISTDTFDRQSARVRALSARGIFGSPPPGGTG